MLVDTTQSLLAASLTLVVLSGCAFDRAVEGGAEGETPAMNLDAGGGDSGPSVEDTGLDSNSGQDLSLDADPGPEDLRVQDGLLALFVLDDLDGQVLPNRAAPDAAMELFTGQPRVVEGRGVMLTEETGFRLGDSGALIDAIKASGQFSLEVWCRPQNLEQDQPARLIGIEFETTNRNVLLSQKGQGAEVRVRRGGADEASTDVVVPDVFSTESLVHLVLTWEPERGAILYVDAVPVTAIEPEEGASLEGWGRDHVMGLANIAVGNRAWLGELHLAAVYSRALSGAEVRENLAAGHRGDGSTMPPQRVSMALDEQTLSEGGQTQLVLTRQGDLDEALTVELGHLGGAAVDEDYTCPAQIVFEAGEERVSVTVAALRDEEVEGPEAAVILLLPRVEYDLGAGATQTLMVGDESPGPALDELSQWMSAAGANELDGRWLRDFSDHIGQRRPVKNGVLIMDRHGAAPRLVMSKGTTLGVVEEGFTLIGGATAFIVFEQGAGDSGEVIGFRNLEVEGEEVILRTGPDGLLEVVSEENSSLNERFEGALSAQTVLVTFRIKPASDSSVRVEVYINGELVWDKSQSLANPDGVWRDSTLGSPSGQSAELRVAETLFYSSGVSDEAIAETTRYLMLKHGL